MVKWTIQCMYALATLVQLNLLVDAIPGNWGPWSLWWPDCNYVTEGTEQNRVRQCNNPPPSGGDQTCAGSHEEIQHCPIHGQWTEWGSWSACNRPCGKGIRRRTRGCTNPAPQYGGDACPGSDTHQEDCVYWDFDNCQEECTECSHIGNSFCNRNGTVKEGFTCECNSGYAYIDTTDTCQDIDECTSHVFPCRANQWCENRDGGFQCFCRDGYQFEPDTGGCTSAFRESYCQVSRNNYKCACRHYFGEQLGIALFQPPRTRLITAPSPVTVQNGTERCVCYFCKQRISELSYDPATSRCSTIEAVYPICREKTSPTQTAIPYITIELLNETLILSEIEAPTLMVANLTEKEFNVAVTTVAKDSIGGCLNSDKQDGEAENAMALLSDCDKAGRELITSIEENVPHFTIDVSASDAETDSSFRLNQNDEDREYIFHCDKSKLPQNYIKVPKIAFIRDKQPVLSTCVKNPGDVLLLSTTDGSFSFEEKNSSSLVVQVNSAVISSTTWPRVFRLPDNHRVEIHFKLLEDARDDWYPRCSWFDFDRKTWRMHSDTEYNGCDIGFQNTTDVLCLCNHLTNFAIVMRNRTLPKMVRPDIDIVAITGSSLCLVASMSTVVLLILASMRTFSQLMLYQLVVTSMLTCFNITFLVGSTDIFNKATCDAVAALLFFFHTTAAYWIVGYVFLFTYKIRAGKQLETLCQYIFLAVFSTVPPVFITIIGVLSNTLYRHEKYCWPSGEGDIAVGLLFPVLLFACLGGLILFCTSRVLTNHARRLDTKALLTKQESQKLQGDSTKQENVQTLVILLTTHCCAWLMFVVHCKSMHSSTLYLFSLLNTMDGFAVMVLFVVMNSQVKQSIAHLMSRTKYRDRAVSPVERISIKNTGVPPFQERCSPEGREASPVSLKETTSRLNTAITAREIKLTTPLTTDENIELVELTNRSKDMPCDYGQNRGGSMPVKPKTTPVMRASSSLNSVFLSVKSGNNGSADILHIETSPKCPLVPSPPPIPDVETPTVFYKTAGDGSYYHAADRRQSLPQSAENKDRFLWTTSSRQLGKSFARERSASVPAITPGEKTDLSVRPKTTMNARSRAPSDSILAEVAEVGETEYSSPESNDNDLARVKEIADPEKSPVVRDAAPEVDINTDKEEDLRRGNILSDELNGSVSPEDDCSAKYETEDKDEQVKPKEETISVAVDSDPIVSDVIATDETHTNNDALSDEEDPPRESVATADANYDKGQGKQPSETQTADEANKNSNEPITNTGSYDLDDKIKPTRPPDDLTSDDANPSSQPDNDNTVVGAEPTPLDVYAAAAALNVPASQDAEESPQHTRKKKKKNKDKRKHNKSKRKEDESSGSNQAISGDPRDSQRPAGDPELGTVAQEPPVPNIPKEKHKKAKKAKKHARKRDVDAEDERGVPVGEDTSVRDVTTDSKQQDESPV